MESVLTALGIFIFGVVFGGGLALFSVECAIKSFVKEQTKQLYRGVDTKA